VFVLEALVACLLQNIQQTHSGSACASLKVVQVCSSLLALAAECDERCQQSSRVLYGQDAHLLVHLTSFVANAMTCLYTSRLASKVDSASPAHPNC
jgi:hypothetical protein